MKLYGCWFHFTQRIWATTQKLGLTQSFKENVQVSKFIRLLMAIPFLPAGLIIPTYSLIETPALPADQMSKLEKLKNYFKKRWLNQRPAEELSVNEINIATNNGAESYHSKLKTRMRCNHPRIWTFMTHINEIIKDTDNDTSRLYQGREIRRPRAKTDLKIGEHRLSLKQKLNNGELTPWEFVQAMSYTVGDIKTHAVYLSSESDLSDVEDEQTTNMEIICSVCLS